MYTYIVVDDEPLTRKGTIKKLSYLGDTINCVGEAGNGLEGLDLIEKENPDIIITDMNMPELDGTMFLMEIRKRLPLIPIIVISGYKDFEYAQSAIKSNACKYILKPFSKEEIIGAVREAIESIEKKQEQTDYITRIATEHENIKRRYDLDAISSFIMGYQADVKSFYSAMISDFLKENESYYLMLLSSEQVIPESTLTEFMAENEMTDMCILIPQPNNNCLNTLICRVSGTLPQEGKPFMTKIASSLIQYVEELSGTLSIGISAPHTSFEELRSAYLEAGDALNSITDDRSNKHYFYSPFTPSGTAVRWPLEEEFLFRVENGETEAVLRLIYNLFEEIRNSEGITLGDAKEYCTYLINQGKEILRNVMPIRQSGSGNSRDLMETIFSFAELSKFMTIFFTNIPNAISSQNRDENEDIIERIKEYIDKKYQNPLNLDFIAGLFYMNPSYISHLFKVRTGETFSNYLTQVRIAKAKYIPKSTEKKPYQVAKQVGYDNEKYFFRVFKKETGVTPEEYRKL
jgi:two-component system response regulator YesN